MLSENDIKEQISYAYVHAVAASAGYSCERPYVDRDSVDAIIQAKGLVSPQSVLASPRIEVQLKATSVHAFDENSFQYRLPIKNYNDLRRRNMLPRILVVLLMPETQAEWLSHGEEGLIARKCAYWVNLLGFAPATQETLVPISVIQKNVFGPEALKQFMLMASIKQDLPLEL